MKLFFFFLSAILSSAGFAQISSKGELMDRFFHFYQQKNRGCYSINYQFKSSIAEDTSKASFVCCYSREEKETRYSIQELLFGSYLLFTKNRFYALDQKKGTFKGYGKSEVRQLSYRQFVEDNPYYDLQGFLRKISKDAFFLQKDSFCILSWEKNFYFFDSKTGELKKIRQIIPVSSGIQYMQIIVGPFTPEHSQLAELKDPSLLTSLKG